MADHHKYTTLDIHKRIRIGSLLLVVLLLVACHTSRDNATFKYLAATDTNIAFSNDITTTDSFNVLNFHYIYNGGGVGVGDFDKNGLPDLVFTGNQVPSKLYLNKGNLSFEDISVPANFTPKGWATGVSIVDINADGWEDIYISVGGLDCQGNCKNQLFIHNGLSVDGQPTFTEQAANYGLADGLYTQQAAFFDVDQDQDLDVYLLHNAITNRDKNTPTSKRFISELSKDQLLLNETIQQEDGSTKIFFKEASEQMNITHRGYGLGITINDFNLDGLPDIYVANDFLSDDLLYLNTKEDGFEEVRKQVLKHTSYNAMGVDLADINNDALPDIMVVDMLSEMQERKKSMQGFMNYNKFILSLRQQYMPQFIRNTLQVHNGVMDKEIVPFSEVGYLSGVYNTDWSWTPLLADFDNDGDRDMFITNGYGKDITDLDFVNYSQSISQFGTKEALQKKLLEAVNQMRDVEIPNYFFENKGNLVFENQSANWVEEVPSISNGAVYSDLDNDGDLDLVVNNINQPAFVLENQTTGNNYLKVQLKGSKYNPQAIGSTVEIWTKGVVQKQFHSLVRGYLSSVDPVLHFGLGQHTMIDSLLIQWHTEQSIKDFIIPKATTIKLDIPVNQTFVVEYEEAERLQLAEEEFAQFPIFKETILQGLSDSHKENHYQDYDFQPLLLKQLSRQGPCLAVANVDGKKGEELFIGGAKGIAGKIYYQKEDGSYYSKALPDSLSEDIDATFLDIDKDGDLDLYVVSGGTEFLAEDPNLKDRVYENDGKGNFIISEQYQSPVNNSGACIAVAKPDKNGDRLLFVGGRVVPKKYPITPLSYLMTDHYKKLIQNTDKFADGLLEVGMVTDAIWSDYNGNGEEDLLITTEWGAIHLFKREGAFLDKPTIDEFKIYLAEDTTQIFTPKGLWSCIATGDFNKDGREDYLLGNLGENTQLKATLQEPLILYKGDFDNNGGPDPVVGHYYTNKKKERKLYPLHARDDVTKQLVKIKSKLRSYAAFGKATLSEVLPNSEQDYLSVNYLSSAYLENKGQGIFHLKALPKAAQLAPIQNVLVKDIDQDGNLDALLVGNDYSAESSGGRQDAFNGLWLRGNGKGDFIPIPTNESGFLVTGDARDIITLKDKNEQELLIVSQNSNPLKIFKLNKKAPKERHTLE